MVGDEEILLVEEPIQWAEEANHVQQVEEVIRSVVVEEIQLVEELIRWASEVTHVRQLGGAIQLVEEPIRWAEDSFHEQQLGEVRVINPWLSNSML